MKNFNDPIIIVKDLWHIYPGNIEALKGVCLKIHQGEFIAILGQNGSGKTTLVKHFNGLLKPTRGDVLVYGMNVKTTPISELATRVGYVFQNPDHQIFSRTVRDELAFGPKNLGLHDDEIKRRIHKVAQTLGLTELLDSNPFDLSLGTRQKIAVGSILTMEPDVLIVDEPTTGQDHRTSREMMDLFTSLNKTGKTIIIITHSMSLAAEYAKRVIVLNDGRVVADGPTRNVFSNIKVLEEAYLTPPQITRLALKLREFGAPVALTVDEMAQFLIDKLVD